MTSNKKSVQLQIKQISNSYSIQYNKTENYMKFWVQHPRIAFYIYAFISSSISVTFTFHIHK
uniref:Uncharacterized protein n=1 Tax=Anguilla anguilla TaxID=7936 RepID=A0A0E9WYI7_ANGAN